MSEFLTVNTVKILIETVVDWVNLVCDLLLKTN